MTEVLVVVVVGMFYSFLLGCWLGYHFGWRNGFNAKLNALHLIEETFEQRRKRVLDTPLP
jgi:membrane protein DedA with SNARE-associated domain